MTSMTLALFKIFWKIKKIKSKKYKIQLKVQDLDLLLCQYKYKITKHNLKDTVILMRLKDVKDQQNH